jgi:hypothetical protein
MAKKLPASLGEFRVCKNSQSRIEDALLLPNQAGRIAVHTVEKTQAWSGCAKESLRKLRLGCPDKHVLHIDMLQSCHLLCFFRTGCTLRNS